MTSAFGGQRSIRLSYGPRHQTPVNSSVSLCTLRPPMYQYKRCLDLIVTPVWQVVLGIVSKGEKAKEPLG